MTAYFYCSLSSSLLHVGHLHSSAANRLRIGRQRELGSIPDDENSCISSPNRKRQLWLPPRLLFSGCRRISLPVVKRPRRETAHSNQSNAKVKNDWSRKSTFLHAFKSHTVTTLPYYCKSIALQNLLISIYAVINTCGLSYNAFNTSQVMCWNQQETTASNRRRLISQWK